MSAYLDVLLQIAAGVALPAILTLLRTQLSWGRSERLAAEASFREAIESDDLRSLAQYLREGLGGVTIDAYLGDEAVARRVDSYLSKLTAFVGAPDLPAVELSAEPNLEQAAQGEDRDELAIEALPERWEPRPDDRPQVVRALASLRAGENWNALARLRRDLETLLRQRAGRLSPEMRPSKGLSIRTLVPPDAVPAFTRFWRTASRAIHGENVTDQEALEAVDEARRVYDILAHLESDESSPPSPHPSSTPR